MTDFLVICSLAEFITVQLIKFSVRTSIDLSFLRCHIQKDNEIFSVPVIAEKPEGRKAFKHPGLRSFVLVRLAFCGLDPTMHFPILDLARYYPPQSSINARNAP
jgi:hypothetical protein